MILRKPYAFLIKYFKLIHLILVALTIYLMHRTNILYSFFKEAKTVQLLSGRELTDNLFNTLMYLVIMFLIILVIVIISLLKAKEKKTLLYFLNLFFYILLSVLYYYCYSQVAIMEVTAVDIRILLMIYDLLGIALFLQFISMVAFAIRATGFDIKKFNFGQDIVDLKIDIEDKEEFEVSLDVDINRVNKKIRQKLRFFKYAYIENRLIINLVACLIFFVGIMIILFFIDNSKIFIEKIPIQTTNYIIEVEQTYETKHDYQGNVLVKDGKFVIIKLNLQTKYNDVRTMRLGMLELAVSGQRYYPTYEYYEKFADIGESYYEQPIKGDLSTYIVAFLLPDVEVTNAVLNFYDGIEHGKSGNNNRIYRISLKVNDLDQSEIVATGNIGSELTINNDFIVKGKLVINDYMVNAYFKNEYQFCVQKEECYSSYEYVLPKYNSNFDKALIRIDGNWEMENKIKGLQDISSLLQMHGRIVYKIDNNQYESKLNLGRVLPIKTNKKGSYYLEIPKEIVEADKITLKLQIRNTIYNYILK